MKPDPDLLKAIHEVLPSDFTGEQLTYVIAYLFSIYGLSLTDATTASSLALDLHHDVLSLSLDKRSPSND